MSHDFRLPIWTDIPDPDDGSASLKVEVQYPWVEKWHQKHLPTTSAEPWELWDWGLPQIETDMLLDELRRTRVMWIKQATLDRFLSSLHSAITVAGKWPLAVSFESRTADDTRAQPAKYQRWLMVLPSGAYAIIEVAPEQYLVSCYFHRTCGKHMVNEGKQNERVVEASKTMAEAAQRAVQQTIHRYCRTCLTRNFQKGGTRAVFQIPQPSSETPIPLPSGKTKELHTQVRFVSEERWGFDRIGRWDPERPKRSFPVPTAGQRASLGVTTQ